jgi:hypothetical protein
MPYYYPDASYLESIRTMKLHESSLNLDFSIFYSSMVMLGYFEKNPFD